MKRISSLLAWLIIGDALAILAVTLIGFLDHYGKIAGWRWLTTYIPVLVAWLAIAPWLGVYQLALTRRPGNVWRPVLAAFLSAPMAAWLRGAWLNTAILPLFVFVMAMTNALGFLLWRLTWSWIVRKYGNGSSKRNEAYE